MVSPGDLENVRELASEHTRISPFMIRRRLRLPRRVAAEALEQLEQEGLVGPPGLGGSREVLKHG